MRAKSIALMAKSVRGAMADRDKKPYLCGAEVS